jgi:RHS repeat-associated protein
VSGELVEVGSTLPNGARETLLTSGAGVPSEPRGFTGKEADAEVGLIYFGARYLLPHLGRWAGPDPLQVHEVGGGEPLNNYHYVAGDLLQSFDPIGLEPRCGAPVCLPPKRLPPEKAMIGNWMHRLVGGMIAGTGTMLGHLMFDDQRLDTITTAYRTRLPASLERWKRLRPDIADAGRFGTGIVSNTVDVAEIKPLGSEALAREEAEAYVWALRQSGLCARLRPSHAAGMTGSLDFALFSLKWSSPMDGVVTYDAKFRLPFPAHYRKPVAERLPARDRLNRDAPLETPPIFVPPLVAPSPLPAAPAAVETAPLYLRLLSIPSSVFMIVPDFIFRDLNHDLGGA